MRIIVKYILNCILYDANKKIRLNRNRISTVFVGTKFNQPLGDLCFSLIGSSERIGVIEDGNRGFALIVEISKEMQNCRRLDGSLEDAFEEKSFPSRQPVRRQSDTSLL